MRFLSDDVRQASLLLVQPRGDVTWKLRFQQRSTGSQWRAINLLKMLVRQSTRGSSGWNPFSDCCRTTPIDLMRRTSEHWPRHRTIAFPICRLWVSLLRYVQNPQVGEPAFELFRQAYTALACCTSLMQKSSGLQVITCADSSALNIITRVVTPMQQLSQLRNGSVHELLHCFADERASSRSNHSISTELRHLWSRYPPE